MLGWMRARLRVTWEPRLALPGRAGPRARLGAQAGAPWLELGRRASRPLQEASPQTPPGRTVTVHRGLQMSTEISFKIDVS